MSLLLTWYVPLLIIPVHDNSTSLDVLNIFVGMMYVSICGNNKVDTRAYLNTSATRGIIIRHSVLVSAFLKVCN